MKTEKKAANAPVTGAPVAAPKTAKFLTKTVDGKGVTFTLGNGKSVRLTFSDYPEERLHEAMAHGFSQKVGDTVAGLSKLKEYRLAEEVLTEQIAGLKTAWNSGRTTTATGGLLAEALARVKGMDIADVVPSVTAASPEQRRAWLEHPAVAKAVADITAERKAEAAAGVSTDDIVL